MSIDPRRIAIQVALRSLQMTGTDQATLEAAYTTANLAALDGADVPKSAIIDAVLAIESQITGIIASDRTHPYRSLFYGRSDDLLSAAKLPSESDEMLRFVGIFSGVKDSTTNETLTEAPIQELRRFLRGNYQTDIFKYAIAGERLYHTRDNAYLEGCVFSGTIARQRFSSPYRLSPIPEVLETTWVAGSLEFLAQENWFAAEGNYYSGIYQRGIAMLRDRNLAAPQLPAIESTPNPASN